MLGISVEVGTLEWECQIANGKDIQCGETGRQIYLVIIVGV